MGEDVYDVVVVGGGHNGLTCGAYLARAGKKALVLECRDVIGGAAVTEEFSPGFHASIFSYVMSILHPKVIRDLGLRESGASRKRRRSLKQLHCDLVTLGYEGSYDRVAAFARIWRQRQREADKRASKGTHVPLVFAPGEAFQFD